MTYFSYTLLLIFLSIIGLIAVALVSLLDFVCTKTRHKIHVLKVSLTLLVLSPMAVGLLTAFSSQNAIFELSNTSLPMQVEKIIAWQDASKGIDCFGLLSFLHVIIFSYLLLRLAFAYFSTKQKLKDSKRVLINGQHVWLNKNINAPLCFGIPGKIYAPENIENSLGARSTELAIAHERAHVENFDTIWKLISLIAQSLLFFVPWSYVFHRKFMLEIETLCDEMARKTTQSDHKEYGSFLLAMAVQESPNFTCTNLTDSTIKRRIVAMKKTTTNRPMLTLLSCFMLTLLSGFTVLGMAGSLSANDDITISSEIFFDGQLISSPVICAKVNQEARLEIGDKEKKSIFTVSVVPFLLPEEQIKLSFNIENKGLFDFRAQPTIVLLPDQKGAASIKLDSGKILELRAVANRHCKSSPKAD